MSHRITAFVAFYFKGSEIAASVDLDLDHHMQDAGKIPLLYPLLARSVSMDIYSYEYEMMQTESIRFRDARGIVADYIHDEILDIEGFEQAWKKQRVLTQLQSIVKCRMGLDDLDRNPELKEALLDAWRLGTKSS